VQFRLEKSAYPFFIFLTLVCALSTPFTGVGQQTKKERKGEFYLSWGYNKEWYTHSNVQVDQPELGNHYTFKNISGHDHPGWDDGIFNKAISIPQYNYRIGYIFNRKKGLGFEINFDHTKFIFADQEAHLQGTLNNKAADQMISFNAANGFFYYLNNGANFLLFNIVKRWEVYHSKNEKLKIDFLGKAGIGPVIPHVENSFFGQKNDPHFQVGGWNVGLEGALRITAFQYIFLEYTNKFDYARYSGLRIYKGTAKQAFGTYEMILNLGVTFPIGKRVD
jgi:hypothetical protein